MKYELLGQGILNFPEQTLHPKYRGLMDIMCGGGGGSEQIPYCSVYMYVHTVPYIWYKLSPWVSYKLQVILTSTLHYLLQPVLDEFQTIRITVCMSYKSQSFDCTLLRIEYFYISYTREAKTSLIYLKFSLLTSVIVLFSQKNQCTE